MHSEEKRCCLLPQKKSRLLWTRLSWDLPLQMASFILAAWRGWSHVNGSQCKLLHWYWGHWAGRSRLLQYFLPSSSNCLRKLTALFLTLFCTLQRLQIPQFFSSTIVHSYLSVSPFLPWYQELQKEVERKGQKCWCRTWGSSGGLQHCSSTWAPPACDEGEPILPPWHGEVLQVRRRSSSG